MTSPITIQNSQLLDFYSNTVVRYLTTDNYLLTICIAVGIITLCISKAMSETVNVDVPAVGCSPWLGPYFRGLRFYYNSQAMIHEGYRKYKSQIFKVPRWTTGWAVIVTGEKLIDEFHYLPENVLSLLEATRLELQVPYTMKWEVHTNPYHLPILRTKVVRHLDHLVREVMEELVPSIEAVVGRRCNMNDWTEFNMMTSVTGIMARSFNRVLVGAPLCRIPGYNDVACDFTVNTFASSTFINMFPTIIRPVAGYFVKRFSTIQDRAEAYLIPAIEERKQLIKDYGPNYPDKPNDVLSWLMDAAEGVETETGALATRILITNNATIHTSSITFVKTLLNLATRPQYMEPLRKEAEEVMRIHGWTKKGIYHLVKMDSFFKETLRHNGLASMTFPRKAVQEFTFSDGTKIPVGAYVSAAFSCHLDDEFYPNASEFHGFRFVDEKNRSDDNDSPRGHGQNAMAGTSPHYLPFGHGRHVCLAASWYHWVAMVKENQICGLTCFPSRAGLPAASS